MHYSRLKSIHLNLVKMDKRGDGWQRMKRMFADAGKPDVPGLYVSRAGVVEPYACFGWRNGQDSALWSLLKMASGAGIRLTDPLRRFSHMTTVVSDIMPTFAVKLIWSARCPTPSPIPALPF